MCELREIRAFRGLDKNFRRTPKKREMGHESQKVRIPTLTSQRDVRMGNPQCFLIREDPCNPWLRFT
jgi:hypothetical protein